MRSISVNQTGNSRVLGICVIAFLAMATVATASAQVMANPPYSVSVFATSVPHVYFQPDSITLWNGRVFIGYGNNATPDGKSGHSTIVEYAMDGTVLHKLNIKGHNDGLKVDPKTNLLWSLQNEDANPYLLIIDPRNWSSKKYTFAKPAHGGGYDDMTFHRRRCLHQLFESIEQSQYQAGYCQGHSGWQQSCGNSGASR